MISINGVTKRYGNVTALRDVSFSAGKGQIVGLLGQNGAGKTTALNILTGYMPPTKGSVNVGGYDMRLNPGEAKRFIGYLPEHPPLYDEMTVRSYLRFVCELKEVSKRAIDGHIDEIAGAVHITEVLTKRIAALSKGYRQRVGIAQALCGAPEALVLDEPTIGLDPKQVIETRELIRQLGASHTVLFSSHILSEVQQLCNRVIILHRGVKILEADMDDLGDSAGLVRLRAVIKARHESLLPALRGIEGIVKTERLSACEDTTEVILTARRADEPEQKLFTLLSGLGAPLLALSRVKDALEDVFLKATGGEDPG